MSKKRCTILIDGSNFYFKLKDLDLHHELEFDFSGFAKKIADKYEIVSCRYYVGAVRTDGTEHTQKLFNRQQKLFAHLKKHQFIYSLGYLLKSKGKTVEYVGFSHQPSVAMVANCSKSRLLTKEDLEPFVKDS